MHREKNLLYKTYMHRDCPLRAIADIAAINGGNPCFVGLYKFMGGAGCMHRDCPQQSMGSAPPRFPYARLARPKFQARVVEMRGVGGFG